MNDGVAYRDARRCSAWSYFLPSLAGLALKDSLEQVYHAGVTSVKWGGPFEPCGRTYRYDLLLLLRMRVQIDAHRDTARH